MKLFIFLISFSSFAEVTFYHHEEKSISPCKDCSLKNVHFDFWDYKVKTPDSESFGSKIVVSFETDNISNLQKYGMVNFMRGCQYSSHMEGKELKVNFDIAHELFDDYATFKHEDWIVDSVDMDPMYNSSKAPRFRHYLYRWNEDPNSIDPKTEHLFGEKSPAYPKLYVIDRPGQAMLFGTNATNISLEFKSCMYRTEDIPLIGSPQDIHIPNALVCFDWKSSFIYNFETKTFEQKDQIEDVCLH